MAQLVVGVLGAVIGSYIPGVGPQVGWAIAPALGMPAVCDGPVLEDLVLDGPKPGEEDQAV